jgi:hypothetical protein
MRVGEFLVQPVERRLAGRGHRRRMQRDELGGEVVGDAADERLLGREIVVQRRDVDAGAVGRAARAQPFEAVSGEAGERRAHEALAALVAARPQAGLLRHRSPTYQSIS